MATTGVDDATQSGQVWTFLGAKGGVGKTTLATNFAAAIASETDQSVLVIDLDTRFPDIALMLEIAPRYSFADLARAFRSEITPALLRQALVRHESDAAVLAAPTHPREWDIVEPRTMQHIVRLASEVFDYIILDTPGAFTDLVGVAVEETDRLLLTTSLERTSVKDTLHPCRRDRTAPRMRSTGEFARMGSARDLAGLPDRPKGLGVGPGHPQP